MLWTILATIATLLGIALIWSVLVKKFPQLKLIDLSTLAKERHAQVKTRIIKDRFERSLGTWGRKTGTALSGVSSKVGGAFEAARMRLKQMERKVEDEKPMDPETQEARIATLLAEAREHASLERYGMAEECYIEVLRLDAKRIEAYRGIAEVYIAQKLYEQARETLEFLVRLHADDEAAFERLGAVEAALGRYTEAEARYLQSIGLSANPSQIRVELGETYLAMNEPAKAWEQFRLALAVEPYNPKYLDYFMETSIALGDADAAEEAFVTLETANPENQKLAEFRTRIDGLRQPAGEGEMAQ